MPAVRFAESVRFSDPESQEKRTTSPLALPETGEDEKGIWSEAVRDAYSLLALRRAATVAHASTAVMIANNASLHCLRDFVRLSRQRIELENAIGGAEHAFLDKLILEMHREEQVQILFELMDVDESGTVEVLELAEGFRKMTDMKAIADVMPVAEKAIETYSRNNKGYLTVAEFEKFLVKLSGTMNCTFHELCQLVVVKIAFATTGRAVLEETVEDLLSSPGETEGHEGDEDDGFNNAVVEARLVLCFDMLDEGQVGEISLRETAKHLFRFTEGIIGKQRRDILLMVDEHEDKMINFEEFSELILNIVAASQSKDTMILHEITDAMTLSVSRQDITQDDIRELFFNHDIYHHALEADGLDEEKMEHDLENGKLNRLFDLWDLDHDGTLDLTECAIGIRKFQETTKHHATLEETVTWTKEALESADADGSNTLNRKEFVYLLNKFASATGVELHRLVDFMVVHSALKDLDSMETDYITNMNRMHNHHLNDWKSRLSRQSFGGLLRRGLSFNGDSAAKNKAALKRTETR